jgi:hypothetical protein
METDEIITNALCIEHFKSDQLPIPRSIEQLSKHLQCSANIKSSLAFQVKFLTFRAPPFAIHYNSEAKQAISMKQAGNRKVRYYYIC